MNVTRRNLRILLMQLCGYNGLDIRKRVLDDNRAKFVDTAEDGHQIT
jgi:hypothetical protein